MGGKWYYQLNGQQFGPLSYPDLQKLVLTEQVLGTDMLWTDGMDTWVPADSIKDLFNPASRLKAAVRGPASPGRYAPPRPPTRSGKVVKSLQSARVAARKSQSPQAAVSISQPVPAQPVCSSVARKEPVSQPAVPLSLQLQKAKQAVVVYWDKTKTGSLSLLESTKGVYGATMNEAKRRLTLRRLHKEIHNLNALLNDNLLKDLGAQLLQAGLSVPGAEALVKKHMALKQEGALADHEAMLGNPDAKKRANQLAKDLDPLYVEFANRALDSGVSFPYRQQWLDRRAPLIQALAEKTEQAENLERQWTEAAPEPRRQAMIGFGAMTAAAFVLATLVFRGILGSFSATAGPPELDSQTAFQMRREAGADLLAFQARLWTLKAHSLQETQALLASKAAKKLVDQDSTNTDVDNQERILRDFLRTHLSPPLLAEARSLLESFNGPTRDYVTETASQHSLNPEEFVLEWLTNEAALDLDMLGRIWLNQGNFRGRGQSSVHSLFDGVAEPPALAAGVRVMAQSEDRLVINLFGARVVERILADRRTPVTNDQTVVTRQSNYEFPRSILKGDSAKEDNEDAVATTDGQRSFDYLSGIKDYGVNGTRRPWALLMREDSILGVAAAVRDDKARKQLGRSPIDPKERESLRNLFAKVAPSSAVVEAVGAGSGSGFLLEQNGKLLVVTNRHQVEGAGQGLAIHFHQTSDDGSVKRHTVAPSRTVVVGVHRSADLALVDVTDAAADLRAWHVKPLTLATPEETPREGDLVFTVGAASMNGGGQVLSQTFLEGVVTGIGRPVGQASYLQVTMPISPANSGGPLCDDQGRVVGVNTLSLRKNESRELALETLNYALDAAFVRDLLTDKNQSLDAKAIAALVNSSHSSTDEMASLVRDAESKVTELQADGYRPLGGDLRASLRIASLAAEDKKILSVDLTRGKTYAITWMNEGSDNVSLAVLDSCGRIVAACTDKENKPRLDFKVESSEVFGIVVLNPSASEQMGILVIAEK